ncbi:PLP-dependent aminotransferase family protein [Roseibium polysiphoniae]|uniref:PLP-dependent aminotransferase family protein n=1 Tax=Roseibium polysiphoniae TaxID=2571221 RepID=A0ABR9C8Q3_9HYPH|nr:PLP-dependent aminotransferase family protein [Roseibium polysiphoniae]MBD8876265.1 PLP-dependent aminotransferase family protein [Roseibium polysiphoniae]
MKVPDLLEGVLSLDRSSSLSLSQQIYRRIREAVGNGQLKPGMRLPSSRKLANRLEVSRNTVNAAFELLQAETIITVEPGSAPTVSGGVQIDGAPAQVGEAPVRGKLSARGRLLAQHLRGDSWAFRHGALQPGAPALDAFPHDLWGRYLRRAARSSPCAELLYENATGHPALTRVLADYLASERGVRTEPDQILVTSSMQAALSGLAQALADPGDHAWMEDPGYIGARSAFHGAGLKICGIPVDREGAVIEAMTGRRPSPRLVYVTPSHSYPFGSRMPLSRRLQLISAAREMGAIVLEDDYDSEFLFEGRPIAALQGLASSGEVIYLGTFSKSFLPGLRISYCVLPKPLVEGVRSVFRQTGRLSNVHAQIALADFMSSGEYRAHLKRIRDLYQQRGLALVEALRGRLGNRIEVDTPTGNVQVAVRFRSEIDDEKLARDLQARGFAVSPLSPCFVERAPEKGLVIGFAAATVPQISQFTDLLADHLGGS